MRFLLALIPSLCLATSSLQTLFTTIDPSSISELFAFYHLYPETEQGQKAIKRAWTLLNLHREEKRQFGQNFDLPALEINAILKLLSKDAQKDPKPLSKESLEAITTMANHLSNRSLPGFHETKLEVAKQLPSEQTDIARTLLLHQFGDDEMSILQYEAMIDLMSLQILARLPFQPTDEQKVHAINNFIFHEMRFRFPPHSQHAKDIDLYTFLPSVLDSRLGVCLGVSTLYLAIAQRIDLPLTIITPPGHIYVAYETEDDIINIETTARGIHASTKQYFGINTKSLCKRNLREVIGLNFMNQAAVAWDRKAYKDALTLYQWAEPYFEDDRFLYTLLGYSYLFNNHEETGRSYLVKSEALPDSEHIFPDTTPNDYLNGNADIECIQAIYQMVDENKTSILTKQKRLQDAIKRYPNFREGHFQLAVTWLQLGRGKEALSALNTYATLEPNNPTAVYYLSMLNLERLNLKRAKDHFNHLQTLLADHPSPKEALRSLKQTLKTLYPS